jgi:hypothetical protein
MEAVTNADVALRGKKTKRAWRLASISYAAILVGCLIIIFGAKIWLISRYGSATPFWDQWDSEASKLYKPYFDGTLHFWSLFDADNEHRIFFRDSCRSVSFCWSAAGIPCCRWSSMPACMSRQSAFYC